MGLSLPSADSRPISNLNTTPLIDVMLVLLIMMIMTIPTQSHKVAIALPVQPKDAVTAPDPVRNRITIDRAGTIGWNGTPVSPDRLRRLLVLSMRLPLEPALDLVPAADARYETIDAVLADIKRAGVTKLGLPGNAAYRAF